MSSLILVRHGQASFGTSNYDKLSEIGVAQSETLGRYWAGRAQRLDAVFSGAQERQRHTLRLVGERYANAGLRFPEPTILEAFNEYDAEAVITALYPTLVEKDHRLRQIAEQKLNISDGSTQGRKAFQKAFEIVLSAWIDGAVQGDLMESYNAFQERVVRGVQKLKSQFPSGKRVAVFTSGGVISAAVGYALDISPHKAMSLQWVIKNSSYTEFIFGADRFTLSGFNHTPHLVDDSLVTYR
ncbi:MAG: histidine phosphatase family protein [Deltaproteobacteria bacterium]|nr:histidine phosphatase family protein [Deltaproteobacteria bacterium]